MDARQERLLEELHVAVVGNTREQGLLNKVDRLDERVRGLEQVKAGLTRGFWERVGTAVVAAASGWFAAHFGGTRP